MKEKQLSNLKYVSESFGSNDHNDKKEEPTTTRKELSKIALKYEQIISERMKERQVERGRNQADYLNNSKSRPNEPLLDKTSKRKELAKIANTTRTPNGHMTVHIKVQQTDTTRTTPFIQFYEICRKNSVDFSARAKYN